MRKDRELHARLTMEKPKIPAMVYYFFAFAFLLAALLMLYKVPYNGDDMINCLTDGGLGYSNRTIGEHTYQLLKTWIDCGRFYPLAFYSYAMFNVFSTLFLYRSFQIILVMACAVSMSYLVKLLSQDDACAVLAVLIFPVFIQFRYYQDPVIAYHGMLQLVALYLIWAVILHVIGLKKNIFYLHCISAALFAMALLTYEISYAFLLVFLVLPFFSAKGKRAFIAMLPYITVAFLVLGITLYFRVIAPNPSYAGISFSFDAYGIVKAFLSQISAAIPLSYYFLATPTFFIYGLKGNLQILTPSDYILAVILTGALFFVFRRLSEKKVDLYLPITGLMFWILPATILSLSARYQTELSPGVGYLPVFVQYFGGILIAVCLIRCILRYIGKIQPKTARKWIGCTAAFFALCFGLVFLLNQANNRIVTKVFADQNTQALSEFALENGFMREVKDQNSLIVMQGGYGMDFEPTSFVYKYSDHLRIVPQKLQDIVDEALRSGKVKDGSIFPENLFIYHASGNLTDGTVQMAKVISMKIDPDSSTVSQIFTDRISFFVAGKPSQGYKLIGVSLDMPERNASFSSDLSGYSSITYPLTLPIATDSTDAWIEIMSVGQIDAAGFPASYFTPDQSTSHLFVAQANDGYLMTFPADPV